MLFGSDGRGCTRGNEPVGQAIEWAYLQPPRPPNPKTGASRNPRQIAAKRLEINEYVKRAQLITHLNTRCCSGKLTK